MMKNISKKRNGNNVELYFFYSPSCPACEKAEITIGKLKSKYPYLQVKKFKIPEKNNQKLYSFLAEIYKIHSDSVPGIFIEEKGFNHCSSSAISKIEKIIIRCAQQQCDSPTQKLLAYSVEKKPISSNFSLNIIFYIAATLVLGLALIKIFLKISKNSSNAFR